MLRASFCRASGVSLAARQWIEKHFARTAFWLWRLSATVASAVDQGIYRDSPRGMENLACQWLPAVAPEDLVRMFLVRMPRGNKTERRRDTNSAAKNAARQFFQAPGCFRMAARVAVHSWLMRRMVSRMRTARAVMVSRRCRPPGGRR